MPATARKLSVATTAPKILRRTASPALCWLVACDESGTGGQRFVAYGSLWMPARYADQFAADVQSICARHGYKNEKKWHKVKGPRLPFWLDLVNYFFDTPWLSFHCMVIRNGLIVRAKGESLDLARRKLFTMLLTNKMHRTLKARQKAQTFSVLVDPIASSYAKADEAVLAIGNNVLRKATGLVDSPIQAVTVCDSKRTPQIELCDVLLGAIADAWQGDSTNEGKARLKSHIARRLGWPDLRHDTLPDESKLNIWYYTPDGHRREAVTLRVDLTRPKLLRRA